MVVGENTKAKPASFTGFMSQEIRMPKYESVKLPKPEKSDELYTVSWPKCNNADVEQNFNQVVGSMSLFAPYSEETEGDVREIQLERPITPINDEIKTPPNSFSQLVKYVRRRIAAKRDAPYLSVEDQQNLAGILMGEVNGIWREVKKQVDDPFMSAEDNTELNRRISVYIVTVCERLFKHYLQKAIVLNSRGIFSGPANMCRLKAQLALDANKLLNILTVRRYIVADMRGRGQREAAHSAGSSSVPPHASPLSFNSLMQCIRPTTGAKHTRYKTPSEELQEICDTMPQLDTGKLLRLLDTIPEGLTDRTTASEDEPEVKIPSRLSDGDLTKSFILEETSRRLVMEKRCESVPLMKGFGDSLMEELNIPQEKLTPDATYNIADLLTGTKHDPKPQRKGEVKTEVKSGNVTFNDLQQLIARSKEIDEDQEGVCDNDDLPSLLQAMTRSKKHDNLRERLENQMDELEKAEREDMLREKVTVKPPAHPQPATVTSKPMNKMAVKTCDIRVSERVCMSSVTLDGYATVYNHLQEEITGGMIHHLDKNLFLEDEIKEVYKEVMKSVPTDHLNLEQDDLVMPSAEKVDLSNLMPSASLSKKKAHRLVNPALERPLEAPWGEADAKDWVRTPKSPPKNFKGEDQFPSVTPNMEKIAEILDAKNNNFKMSDNIPPALAEKMARTYASWYQWWKNQISTDDYMKYVSTQDTDFLGVVYHFYDPDDEDGEDFTTPSPIGGNYPQLLIPRTPGVNPPSREAPATGEENVTKEQALSMEREQKMTKLKAQKSEYKEGFWNVNAVMLGGLGKDPVVEDKDLTAGRVSPESDSSRKAKLTLHARVAARRSARSLRPDPSEIRPPTAMSRPTSSVVSKVDSVRSSASLPKVLSPQERLEKVWNALFVPDSHRLDMAIKYSCNEFYKVLEPAMTKWEQVAELIVQREAILVRLEKFERSASDPNRFFVKGHKGSSAARLDEARQRSYYYGRIEDLEEDIKSELDYIKNNFNDDVTYKGRPYTDKMKWDRIEMLYWLSEERKNNAIKYETVMKPIPLKPAHLDPLLLDSRG